MTVDVWLSLLAVGGLVLTAAYVGLARRHTPSWIPGVVILLACAELFLAHALQLYSRDLETKLLWFKMIHVGYAVAPTGFLWLALIYSGRARWLTRRTWLLLSIIPGLTILFDLTNESHGLLWNPAQTAFIASSASYLTAPETGFWYWLFTIYCYLLMTAGCVLLGEVLLRSRRIYGWRAGALVSAGAFAALASMLDVFFLSPLPPFVATELGLAVGIIAVAWLLASLQRRDMISVTRASMIDSISDALVIVDESDRLVEMNPAAEKLAGKLAAKSIGQALAQVWPELKAKCDAFTPDNSEIVLAEGNTSYTFDVRISPIVDWRGRLVSRVVALRDITRRKQAEELLNHKVKILSALAEIDREIIGITDAKAILELVCRQAARLLNAPKAIITLHEGVSSLNLTAGFGLKDLDRARAEFIVQRDRGSFRGVSFAGHSGFAANSIGTDPPFMREFFAQERIQAFVVVPLILDKPWAGFLTVLDTVAREWSDDDRQTLQMLAGQAAIAADKARLFEETQRHAREVLRLNDIGVQLNSSLDLETVLQQVADVAREISSAREAIVFFRSKVGEPFHRSLASIDPQRIAPGTIKITTIRPGGLTDAIFRTGEPIVSPDLADEPRASPNMYKRGIRSQIGVPIRTGAGIAGVLFANSDRLNAFGTHEQELLSILANQAASAIQNARLYAHSQRRLSHVQALREIDQAITESIDLDKNLAVVLEKVSTQLGADASAIQRFDPVAQRLEYRIGRGFRTPALRHTCLLLGEGHAGMCALKRAVIQVPDLTQDPGSLARSPLLAQEGFVEYYAAPLVTKGQLKGVLEIFNCTRLDREAEWLEFMQALAGQAAIAIDNAELFESLQRSNTGLVVAYDTTIEGWSRALDLRDNETEGHSTRVAETTLDLAQAMGIAGDDLVHIRRGALLHDIGKMGVPDSILRKPGPLTEEEWKIMRLHPVYANDLLSPIGYLQPALEIPYCHHEKWDGTGYPRRLTAEQIPLAARIFSVVDVWDALRSDRPYRAAWSEERVRAYIREQAGAHFDPSVVQVFLDQVAVVPRLVNAET